MSEVGWPLPCLQEPFTGLRDGKTMGTHKTPYCLPFSNRRETCPYSRGTREDAAAGITPRARRRLNREAEMKKP